jgi:Fur family zinc uptake transcriptional regulator
MENATAGFPPTGHDHAGCVSDALRRAEQVCERNGARLTGLRRRVLELVWESHRPVGAYDILKELAREQRAAPPTVYRALDFLQGQGLVHRLASLNAYVGCANPAVPHAGQFLICGSCRESTEIMDENVTRTLRRAARVAGFEVRQQTVEITGTCDRCRGLGESIVPPAHDPGERAAEHAPNNQRL